MAQTILKGATLIDGTGAPPIPRATVFLDGDKIASVGPASLGESAGDELDLSGKYLVPGLIDTHVHICSQARKFTGRPLQTPAGVAVSGALNAVKALKGGVTTVRDCGSPWSIAIQLRDMINGGYIPGPRICASGQAIAMTGGHGVHDPAGISLEVDCPDEARKAVRQMRKAGADCIKLMANGLSLNSPELTEEEMRAAVDAAHDAGMKVACHASVWSAVDRAIAAGVDSIDHGFTLSQANVDDMVRQGTCLVATFNAILGILETGRNDPHWGQFLEVIQRRVDTATESFQRALTAGVTFAMGTDASTPPLAELGQVVPEMKALVMVGLTPMKAIQAATSNAARLLGWEGRIGTLEPGKLADILVVNRNPLDDVGALGDIHMVIKGGAIIVQDGHIAEPN